MQIAVLGCGRIGRMHAENIAAHPRATLAGVFDVHRPAADDVGRKLGVTVFESADALFVSSDVDAVLIATSTPHMPISSRKPSRPANRSYAKNRSI